MKSSRRLTATIAAIGVVLGCAVVVGRWERSHSAAVESMTMAKVMAAAGPDLTGPMLSGWSNAGPLRCLHYDTPKRIYALSLCFDAAGRLAETTDARTEARAWASLRYQPSLSHIPADPTLVDQGIAVLNARAQLSYVSSYSDRAIERCRGRVELALKRVAALVTDTTFTRFAPAELTETAGWCSATAATTQRVVMELGGHSPELSGPAKTLVAVETNTATRLSTLAARFNAGRTPDPASVFATLKDEVARLAAQNSVVDAAFEKQRVALGVRPALNAG